MVKSQAVRVVSMFVAVAVAAMGLALSASLPAAAVVPTGEINPIAGNGTSPALNGTLATSTGINSPYTAVTDSQGDIIYSDAGNNRVRLIAKNTCSSSCAFNLASTTAGNVYTIGGTGSHPDSGDGGTATSANIYTPNGLYVDAHDNVFVAEADGFRIRMIAGISCSSACPFGLSSTTIGFIYGIAGVGGSPTSYAGEGALATSAHLTRTFAPYEDAQGNLLILDYGLRVVAAANCASNCAYGLASTTANHIYTLVDGTGPAAGSGDGGPSTSAVIGAAYDVLVDRQGNVLLADSGESSVRMIAAATCSSNCAYGLASTTKNNIYKMAGTGIYSVSGDGGLATAATLKAPSGLALDKQGNVIVSDYDANQLRLIAGASCSAVCSFGLSTMTKNHIYLIGGNGGTYSGDGGQALLAGIEGPQGVALDANNNLLVTDYGDNHIRIVKNGPLLPTTFVSASTLSGSASTTANLGPVTVTVKDQYDMAYNANSGEHTVSLTSGSSTGVFSTSLNGSPVTSLDVPLGSNTVSFYFGDSAAGSSFVGLQALGAPAASLTTTIAAAAPTPPSSGGGNGAPADHGYTMFAADGGAFVFGDDKFFGSMATHRLNAPIVSGAKTPSGNGYWQVASDGGVFSFGDAQFYGSMGGLHLNKPVVAIVPTASGHGYYEIASDGGVFSYGDAGFVGSLGATRLNQSIIGGVVSGNGYLLAASDGGVFAFGGANFGGSLAGTKLTSPIVGIAATSTNGAYLLVSQDGGVFPVGGAQFHGAPASLPSVTQMVSVLATNAGYVVVAKDGGVFVYGDAKFQGSLGATKLNAPIVSAV